MCFSLGWVVQLAVWLVIIIALYKIIGIVLPWLASKLGADGSVITAVLSVVLWAFIAIVVIYMIAALISCLFSLGTITMPLFPHR